MKYTKGPWRVGRSGPNMCPTVGTHKGLMIAMVCHGEEHPTDDNANLIAAAPELFVALQRCLNFVEGTEAEFGEEFECGKLAREAIAKVCGKEYRCDACGSQVDEFYDCCKNDAWSSK